MYFSAGISRGMLTTFLFHGMAMVNSDEDRTAFFEKLFILVLLILSSSKLFFLICIAEDGPWI